MGRFAVTRRGVLLWFLIWMYRLYRSWGISYLYIRLSPSAARAPSSQALLDLGRWPFWSSFWGRYGESSLPVKCCWSKSRAWSWSSRPSSVWNLSGAAVCTDCFWCQSSSLILHCTCRTSTSICLWLDKHRYPNTHPSLGTSFTLRADSGTAETRLSSSIRQLIMQYLASKEEAMENSQEGVIHDYFKHVKQELESRLRPEKGFKFAPTFWSALWRMCVRIHLPCKHLPLFTLQA